ncbi:MAG: serine hydrolase [Candidatus Dactylopiibacterium sp.]|nr:serine hydrolase [Candidatus Dactylopiibacterium sp.]
MRASHVLAGVLSILVAVVTPVAAEAASKTTTKKSSTQTKSTRQAAPAKARVTKPKAAKPVRTVAKPRATPARPRAAMPGSSEIEREFDHVGNPLLRSSAFIVQEVNSGRILLEKNSAVAVPIASITKLMTSMIVLDAHQSLSEILEITDDDVDRLKGTSSRLAVGTRLSREELLRLALMASENRAASALARNYPGGMHAFLEAVTVKAHMMGLSETRLFDGTGLNKNNVSSPRDLAVLVANASRYPIIREFSTSPEYTAELARGRSHTFHNTNALVKSPDWQIDVQKTGFINESGKCLVMQAWMGNRQLAIVLLDSSGRYTRIADANRIRKWLEANAAFHSQPFAASSHGNELATSVN